MKDGVAALVMPGVKFALAVSLVWAAGLCQQAASAWTAARKSKKRIANWPIRYACVPYVALMMLAGYCAMLVSDNLVTYAVIGVIIGLTTPLRMMVFRKALNRGASSFDLSLLRRLRAWVARTFVLTLVHAVAWPISVLYLFTFYAEQSEPIYWDN